MYHPSPTVQRWVVCAAVQRKSDGLILAGARHYDSIMRAAMVGLGTHVAWRGCEQGFIDQFGVFMSRLEAWHVAAAANQVDPTRTPGELFSEDLY